MKFVLLSRHTGNQEIPENEKDQNMKDLMEWMALIKAEIAMPIRGGKSVTSSQVVEYAGDLGGVIIFVAENIDQAVMLAQKSPGLKYGYTHEVFPEISMVDAARK